MRKNKARGKHTVPRSGFLVSMLLAALLLVLSGCSQGVATLAGPIGQSAGADAVTEKTADQAEAKSAPPGEDLVIPIGDITDQAAFFPVQVEDVNLEVIAVKAPDGSIRTAFNTCQICYDSGRGYYEQSGDMLVCQNCGNRFRMAQVEVESGGCNPWPIFAKDKIVTEESITIPYGFLKEMTAVFENWKVEY